MPPPFAARVTVNLGVVTYEAVTYEDADAREYWRLDHNVCLHNLRQLPMVWNLALVQEGGLGLPLFEEMLEAEAANYEEDYMPWLWPPALGGNFDMWKLVDVPGPLGIARSALRSPRGAPPLVRPRRRPR